MWGLTFHSHVEHTDTTTSFHQKEGLDPYTKINPAMLIDLKYVPGQSSVMYTCGRSIGLLLFHWFLR